VRDARRQPQIRTPVVLRALAVMFLGRRGSLHALGQTRRQPFWSRWLAADLPSADTLGRVATQMQVADLRAIQQQVYAQLKRGKALPPAYHGLIAAVIDGHESHATFRRHCLGCLTRRTITRRCSKMRGACLRPWPRGTAGIAREPVSGGTWPASRLGRR
jgi:hypothetical protein